MIGKLIILVKRNPKKIGKIARKSYHIQKQKAHIYAVKLTIIKKEKNQFEKQGLNSMGENSLFDELTFYFNKYLQDINSVFVIYPLGSVLNAM